MFWWCPVENMQEKRIPAGIAANTVVSAGVFYTKIVRTYDLL